MLDIGNIAYQLPIQIDFNKALAETTAILNAYKKPNRLLEPDSAIGISVTGTAKTPLDHWYDYNAGAMGVSKDRITGEQVTKDWARYTLGFPGAYREIDSYYKNGTPDHDLIQWHPDMVNSEMYSFKDRIASFFNIDNNLRCRLSFINGHWNIPKHSDPHTPWRVHVNLKSGPNCHWRFHDIETKESITWQQPTGSVWLIRTGNIQHEVVVPAGESRWQLFYHIWERNLGPNYHQMA
jgi:hypothetical protein